MELAHSSIGASTCHRWWECAGSNNLIATCPPAETSKYAIEGTAAHEVAERCLRTWLNDEVENMSPHQFIEEEMSNGWVVTEDMAEHVLGYINMIYADLKPYLTDKVFIKDILKIEHKFNLKWIHKDMFGTCDAMLYIPFLLLKVYDLKYGAGVPVEVKENKQAMYYGLGGAQVGDVKEIELVIYQPRAPHADGSCRRWVLSPTELTNFGIQLKARALKTLDHGAKRKAGSWCKFCPAQPVCDTVREKVQEVAKVDFAQPAATLRDPKDMDPKTLGNILKFVPLIDDWLKQVTGHAQVLAESGQDIPGYKLVKKRSNRKFRDEQLAADNLDMLYGEDVFIKKLKPLGQLEKIATKDEINALCYKPEAGNVLVEESDKREPVKPSAIEDFS